MRFLIAGIGKSIQQDIQRLLSDNKDEAADQGLVSRIEDVATGFTAEHPQVAGLLRRLADALSQIGI